MDFVCCKKSTKSSPSPETSLVCWPQSALCICKRADRTRPRTRVVETIPGWDLLKWNSFGAKATCSFLYGVSLNLLKTSIASIAFSAFSVYVCQSIFQKGLHCRHTWPRFLPMPDLSVQRRGTTAALKADKAKHIKASNRTFISLSFIVAASWRQVREQNKIYNLHTMPAWSPNQDFPAPRSVQKRKHICGAIALDFNTQCLHWNFKWFKPVCLHIWCIVPLLSLGKLLSQKRSSGRKGDPAGKFHHHSTQGMLHHEIRQPSNQIVSPNQALLNI